MDLAKYQTYVENGSMQAQQQVILRYMFGRQRQFAKFVQPMQHVGISHAALYHSQYIMYYICICRKLHCSHPKIMNVDGTSRQKQNAQNSTAGEYSIPISILSPFTHISLFFISFIILLISSQVPAHTVSHVLHSLFSHN